jgi:DNA-binding transcriptional LysR family regulator
MLDVRKLVMLRAVAKEGSIASAARALSYTRSAVSQQLNALEAETGVQLMIRSGNRVRLTPAGAALVGNTEKILTELRAAEAMLDNSAGEVRGFLRIGVPFREGPGIMVRALREVRQRHPALEIQLVHILGDHAPIDIREERLDVAIVSRFASWPEATSEGIKEWIVSHDQLRLYVTVEHVLAHASAPVPISDLRDEPWILSHQTQLGRLTRGLCNGAGFEPIVAALVDDVSIAVRLAGVGWGITLAPQLTPVVNELPVERLEVQGLEAERESVLIVRAGDDLSPRLAVVIDSVRKAARVAAQQRNLEQAHNAPLSGDLHQ